MTEDAGGANADVTPLLREYRETERLASIRAWEALMLARTPEAWLQLQKGHPVPEDQLDPAYLRRNRNRHVRG